MYGTVIGNARGDLRTPPRVLIVEDDPFLSLHVEMVLEDAGFMPVCIISRVDEGLRFLTRETLPDVAVLDINLHGALVFPLACELAERGVPFVFVSAYASDADIFPPALRDRPRLTKPVDEARLIEAVEALLEG